MHTVKCLKWSGKSTDREEHSDSNHKLSRDDGNEYGRTGMYTGRAGKGPVSPPAGGAAIGSKLGLLLQRCIYNGFGRLYFKYSTNPSSDRGTKSELPRGLEHKYNKKALFQTQSAVNIVILSQDFAKHCCNSQRFVVYYLMRYYKYYATRPRRAYDGII